MRDIPSFFAIMPERIGVYPSRARTEGEEALGKSLQLDFDVDAGGEIELHQRVDRLRRGIDDVEHPLVRANLELLARLLVDVRRTVDGEFLDPRRQRNGSADPGAGALGRGHDLLRRSVEHPVVERLETDADVLRVHVSNPCRRERGDRPPRPFLLVAKPYSVIETTTPEPTVRPPSRMAKRSFSSIAIGTISATSIVTLSPGITISVPSGKCTTPVTSVVRK